MRNRFILLVLLLLSATGAKAAVLLTLEGGAPTPDGSGGFTYVYDARLQASAVLQPTDFVTLYDFAGLSGLGPTSFVPDPDLATLGTFAFQVSSLNVGPVPIDLKVPVTDSAAFPNVTVTLIGTENIVPPGRSIPLGTLTLTSSIGDLQRLSVASEFQVQGLGTGNRSTALGPVPEPSTYAFMALGLLAAGLSCRARNRHS